MIVSTSPLVMSMNVAKLPSCVRAAVQMARTCRFMELGSRSILKLLDM